jgi:hypothetical protein
MADPDAARLGYSYNPTKKPKNMYSKKPRYTPPPSQAVFTSTSNVVSAKHKEAERRAASLQVSNTKNELEKAFQYAENHREKFVLIRGKAGSWAKTDMGRGIIVWYKPEGGQSSLIFDHIEINKGPYAGNYTKDNYQAVLRDKYKSIVDNNWYVVHKGSNTTDGNKVELNRAVQLKKVQKHPNGDIDHDGIPNKLDNSPLKINEPQKKVVEINTNKKVFISGSMFGDMVGSNAIPKSVLEKVKEYEKKDGKSYAIKVDPITQKYYIVREQGKVVENKKYNQGLDPNNDGTSGTAADYRILAKRKLKQQEGKTGGTDGSEGGEDASIPGNGDPSNRPGRSRSNDNRRNGSGESDRNRDDSNNSSRNQTGGNTLIKDPNGNNLLARFTKVYGEEGKAKLREALDAFKAAGGTVDENYQIGQYGYNVRIKVDGKWIAGTDEVKEKLVAHASASAAASSTYSDPTSAQAITRLNLLGAQGGGTEKGLSRRFALAYGGGDTARGNQVLTAAIAAYKQSNPNKIDVQGTLGQPGAYVRVMHNGEWTSNSDIVAQTLASSVNLAASGDPVTKPFKEQTNAQQAFLGGANGNSVLSRFNLAFNATGTDALEQAIDRYEKLNPGNDIKVHGKPGEQGFWIEVKTKDGGWSSDTDAVLKRLSTDSRSAGATATNQNGADGANGSPASSPQRSSNESRPDRAKKSEESKGAGGGDVSISEAAQKSQALMAADLNKDGTVTKKEDTVLNAADRNNNGVVSAKEVEKFVAVADADASGTVERTEAKAYKMVDSNDNGKISKKELKAYDSIAGKDGEISKKEAKQALKAQIDNKQDQREHDLAKEYLAKTSEKSGGSQVVGDQAAALVNAQTSKPNKPDNDGPGKKKKK